MDAEYQHTPMSIFDALTAIPCALTAGEIQSWTETLSEYPDPTYRVLYLFGGQTPRDGWKTFEVAGVGVGSAWTFTTGNTYKPGKYTWEKKIVRVSDSLVRIICRGTMIVRPNLSVAPTATAAATALANIETAIATLSSSVNQTVSFNGQSYTKGSMETYLKERTRLQAEVYREQQRTAALLGEQDSHVVDIHFARTDCQ